MTATPQPEPDEDSATAGTGPRSRRDPTPDAIRAAHGQLLAAAAAHQAAEHARALALCEALLARHPEYVGALHLAGRIHLAIGEPEAALARLDKAAALHPGDPAIAASVAAASVALGVVPHDSAGPDINEAAAQSQAGASLLSDREFDRAAVHLRRAVALDPAAAEARLNLGRVLLQLGDIAGAVAALEAHIALAPDSVAALQLLAQVPPEMVRIDLDAALTRREALPEASADEQTRLEFARANFLDRRGRYAEAWDRLMLANGLVAAGHAAAREAHRRERREQVGWVSRFDLHPATGSHFETTSLFILGVSRSGKSTLESLLARLPGVTAGYENMAIRRAAAAASQSAGLLTIRAARRLPRQLEAPFAAHYATEVRRRVGDARLFVSTQPGALLEAGALVNALGNVRFVLMRRDSEDTAIRMLFRHYRDRMVFAYDLRAALDEITNYGQLMEAWQARLPDHCIAMTYEDLVTDPEAQVRRVCALCSIDRGIGPLPAVPDDRGAARPYREAIAAALAVAPAR